MTPIKCIIVEDDEIDLLMVKSLILKTKQFEIIATYQDALQACGDIKYKEAEVLFLDIDLDGINGIEFRKIASEVPICIFITSYPEHALETYNVDTLDFIVKPLTNEKFNKSLIKIQQRLDLYEKANFYNNLNNHNFIIIKEGHQQIKILIKDIEYLEALKDYTIIHTLSKKHLVLNNLGNFIKKEVFQEFIRIHRKYAVPRNKIFSKSSFELTLNSKKSLPIGRHFKEHITL